MLKNSHKIKIYPSLIQIQAIKIIYKKALNLSTPLSFLLRAYLLFFFQTSPFFIGPELSCLCKGITYKFYR